MQTKRFIAAIALLTLTAWRDKAPEWPASGPMPDEPGHAPRFHYDPVDKGTRSYRPVDPMPWGDVNRRVTPQGAIPSAPTDPKSTTPAAPMQMKPGEPMQMTPDSLPPPATAAPTLTPEAPVKAQPAPATPPPANASPPATLEAPAKVDPVPRELPTDPEHHQGH